MISEQSLDSEGLRSTPLDWTVVVLRGIAGLAPIGGSVLQEVIGAIPQQRTDRIVDFILKLERKVENVEAHVIQKKIRHERCADIFEEGIRQASHSLSAERRQHIASIVAKALTVEDLDYQEQRFLLKMLDEINDIQIVLLTSSLRGPAFDNKKFVDEHKTLLDRGWTHVGSTKEEEDAAAMQEGLKKHLSEIGLLSPKYRVEKLHSEGSSIEKVIEKALEPVDYTLSHVGKLFLVAIGVIPNMEGIW